MHNFRIFLVIYIQLFCFMYLKDLKKSSVNTFENQTACLIVTKETESYTTVIKKTSVILTWGVGKVNLVDAYKSRVVTYEKENELKFCFNNTSRDDAGTYVWNDMKSNSRSVELNVWYGPAQMSLIPNLTSVIFDENNSSLEINCMADCNPKCTFFWKKDQNVIVSNSSFLEFRNLSKKDRGNYSCIATNPKNHDYNDSTGLQIYVNYAPTLALYGDSDVVELSSVKLTCSVDSNPMSNISWFTENGELNTSSVRKNEIILNLHNTTCDDSRIYSCSAYNGIGTFSYKNISINVLCKPRFIGDNIGQEVKKRITASIGDEIQINISIKANPLPNVLPKDLKRYISISNLSDRMYDLFFRKDIKSVSDFRQYLFIIRNSQGNATIDIEVKASKSVFAIYYRCIIGITLCLMTVLTVFVLIYKIINRNRKKHQKDDYDRSDTVHSDDTGGYRDNILYESIDSVSDQAQRLELILRNYAEDDVSFPDQNINENDESVNENAKIHVKTLDDVSLNLIPDQNQKMTNTAGNTQERKPIPTPRESKMRH